MAWTLALSKYQMIYLSARPVREGIWMIKWPEYEGTEIEDGVLKARIKFWHRVFCPELPEVVEG